MPVYQRSPEPSTKSSVHVVPPLDVEKTCRPTEGPSPEAPDENVVGVENFDGVVDAHECADRAEGPRGSRVDALGHVQAQVGEGAAAAHQVGDVDGGGIVPVDGHALFKLVADLDGLRVRP